MASFDQESRIGRLLIPTMPPDTLVLLEFSGTEFINDISAFRIRALTENSPISLDDFLGKPMIVEFNTIHGLRHFNLTVFSARFTGKDQNYFFYDFELRPWIWAMSRRETSRIFPDMKPEDIISKVLNEYSGLTGSAHKFELTNTPPKSDYVVQYRETDLNFVRRLMEEWGINFHIKMDQNKQTLVMSDSTLGFSKAPGVYRDFRPVTGVHEDGGERFKTWVPQRMLTTGKVTMKDYDFEKSDLSLEVSQQDQKTYQTSDLESFDYPGRYLKESDGKSLAKRRLDAFRSGDSTVRGDGNVLSLGAGMTFTLSDHPINDENVEHVCLSAHHHYSDGGYRSGGSHAATYEGYYSLTKSAAPIAPERVSPRGFVRGPQTAKVVDGMDGEVDKYGRITVKFHWDTANKSMKCRVSQMWAGSAWGTIFVPRAGMEVIVEFLEGDPDRPMIMGCVYNDKNMPPYKLPDKKQISGFKTQTMGGSGYNELIFDDTSGSELIRVHGQKDLEVTIEHDETHTINNDSTRKIIGKRTDTIEKTQDITVVGARTVTVENTETKTVTKKLKIESKAEIELLVGASSIVMTTSSIKIKSPNITIEADIALQTSGSATAKHTSGGVVQIEAPLVKIN